MKRILALLLSGLLLLSFTACVSGGGDNESDTETETVDATGTESESSSEDEYDPDEPLVWKDVDEAVYAFKSITLREEINGDSIRTLEAETVLHRTRVSEDWSFVEITIDGEEFEGYVSNKYITTVNILGTDMTAVPGGSKTMYVVDTNVLKIREYPVADDSVSEQKGTLNKGDAVKVVATNNSWCKIEITEKGAEEPVYRYVSAKYLSETKDGTSSAKPSYTGTLSDCEQKTLYTTHDGVILRTDPMISSETAGPRLPAGTKFVATKFGSTTYKKDNGESETREWYYGTATIPAATAGTPSTTKTGYLAAEFLTETAPEKPSDKLTIEQILDRYPDLKATEQTVYVVMNTSVNLRKAPATGDENASNIIVTVKSEAEDIKSFKALAIGVINGEGWYVVEYVKDEETVNAFISARADLTTTDPTGTVKLTRENLAFTYTGFELQAAGLSVTTEDVANCYNTLKKVGGAYTYPTDENGTDLYAKTLQVGETVTLVAIGSSEAAAWYVIENGGVLYFAPVEFFAPLATNG